MNRCCCFVSLSCQNGDELEFLSQLPSNYTFYGYNFTGSDERIAFLTSKGIRISRGNCRLDELSCDYILVSNQSSGYKSFVSQKSSVPIEVFNLTRVKKIMESKKNALEVFLLNYFKVNDIADVNPYAMLGPDAAPGWKETHEVTITVNLLPNGKVPPPKKPQEYAPKNFNQPIDYNNVSVRTILIRYAKNDSDQTAYIKTDFDHISGREYSEMQRDLIAAGGGIPNCCLVLPPKTQGPQKVFALTEMEDCMFLHEYFIKTFLLITPKNLENGILFLQPDLCAAAGLPKNVSVFDSEQMEVFFDVDFYVLIPADGHILSWCLSVNDHWRKLKSIFALEIRVKPKDMTKEPFILYYVVPNKIYEELKKGCIERFMYNKVDRRNLASVGLDVLPPDTQVKASINYFCYRQNVNLDTVIPTLDKNFPPFIRIIENEVRERQMREEMEKRKNNQTQQEGGGPKIKLN